MEKFEALEKAMCKEMEAIEQKLKGGTEMSVQDLDRIDKLAHAMKSLVTYKAMKEAEEYGEAEESSMNGYSGRRGRAMNGQYVSRNNGNQQSYANGYSEGYSAAMNRMSGNMHYPQNW